MQFLYVTLIRMNSFTYTYYVVLYGFILGLLYGGGGGGGQFLTSQELLTYLGCGCGCLERSTEQFPGQSKKCVAIDSLRLIFRLSCPKLVLLFFFFQVTVSVSCIWTLTLTVPRFSQLEQTSALTSGTFTTGAPVDMWTDLCKTSSSRSS